MDSINKIHKQFKKLNYEQQHLLLSLLAREHASKRNLNMQEKWKELLDKINLDLIDIKMNFITNEIPKLDDLSLKERPLPENIKNNRYICNIIIKYNDIEYIYNANSNIKKDAKKKAIKLAYNTLNELITKNNLFREKRI